MDIKSYLDYIKKDILDILDDIIRQKKDIWIFEGGGFYF